MTPKTFEITMDSNVEDATLASAVVRAFFSRLDLDEHESDMVELCLQEALVNCVRHAYHGESGQVVRLRMKLAPSTILFEVEDQGDGVERDCLQEAIRKSTCFDPSDPTTIASGGRGMLIINEVMDSWDYIRRDNRNVLTMSKTFQPATTARKK